MKFSVAPLSSSAFSLATPRAQTNENGTLIDDFLLMYIICVPTARTQAEGSEPFKNPQGRGRQGARSSLP